MFKKIWNWILSLFKKPVVIEPVKVLPPEPVVVPEPVKPKTDFDLTKGFALIKEFEGCFLTAYPDPGSGGDPWTIGWGHTGSDVYPGLVISQAKADELFEQDMQYFVNGTKNLIKVPCTDEQFGALVSFAYNCGLGALGGSTLLKYFNSGNIQAAADQFPLWNRAANGVMPGLVRRRAAERALFLS